MKMLITLKAHVIFGSNFANLFNFQFLVVEIRRSISMKLFRIWTSESSESLKIYLIFNSGGLYAWQCATICKCMGIFPEPEGQLTAQYQVLSV